MKKFITVLLNLRLKLLQEFGFAGLQPVMQRVQVKCMADSFKQRRC